MAEIPYGETRCYGELAELSARPRARSGGPAAATRSRSSIPCHRVLARTGLGGYSGAGGSRQSGVCSRSKARRLDFEGAETERT